MPNKDEMYYDDQYVSVDSVDSPSDGYYDDQQVSVASVSDGLALVGDLVTSSPNLFGPASGGAAFDNNYRSSDIVSLGGLASSNSNDLARREQDSGSWIDKFIKGIKDSPDSAKIVAGMLGGLYTAANQKKQNAIENRKANVQEDRLRFDRDTERRRASSMQGVTVPGMGLINSKPTQPKFNPNIYPQFQARGQK